MGRKSYLNASKMVKMCRVCLTQSTNVMYELTNDMTLDGVTEIPILQALEKVVAVKVLLNEEFPQYICPICMSILKMTYKFVSQFEDTQRKLKKMFGTSPTYDSHESDFAKKIEEIENVDVDVKDDSAPVEIIFRENKFDLKDVIVVEEVKHEEPNFNAFLKNLGQEVSASFAKKFKTKSSQPPTEDAVSIYVTDSENGVLPIKELKIDDDTNVIDYIVVEDSESRTENFTDEESDRIQYIEIDSPNDIEALIVEGPESDDKEINKENYTLDPSNIQDVIESLIIETTGNEDDKRDNESNSVDQPRVKKVVKVGKRKKTIQERKLEDMIIMGPAINEGNEDKTNEDEDDIFIREMQFPCELCKKIFGNNRALRAHKRRSHFPKERQFTCEICGYKNNTRSGYVHHKNKHIGKKFTCEVCNKTYYTRAVLKVHMATHVNKRQHLCNVCGKGFNYANALIYHMRLHTGERNYKCEYCGDKFRMPNSLKRHMCIHTGERPYKCRFCSRGFCSRGEVQCHENIHTGYRPYHCKHCLKGFTKTHNLKLHLLSHKGPHGCDICGKSFIEMSILSMHYKIAHKDLLEKEDEAAEQL